MLTERKYRIASQEIAAGRWVASSLRDGCADEILIGYWNSETKAQVDAAFKFKLLDADKPAVSWFSTAEDCWLGLAELGTPFLEMLASLDEKRLGHLPTVAEVAAALETLGFVSERRIAEPATTNNRKNKGLNGKVASQPAT